MWWENDRWKTRKYKIKSQLTWGFLLQTTHSSQTGDRVKSFQTEYYWHSKNKLSVKWIPHVLQRLQYSTHLLNYLMSRYALPNFDARITHLQINANLNFGERAKKYTRGKVGWKGVTRKNLTFSLVFQRNLKSIVATIKSHTGSYYHRIAWQMLFYSHRSAWSSMRRNNYNDLDFHYLMITRGKIFKAAFNTNTKPLKPMPSVDSYTLLKIIAPINIEKIFRIP